MQKKELIFYGIIIFIFIILYSFLIDEVKVYYYNLRNNEIQSYDNMIGRHKNEIMIIFGNPDKNNEKFILYENLKKYQKICLSNNTENLKIGHIFKKIRFNFNIGNYCTSWVGYKK